MLRRGEPTGLWVVTVHETSASSPNGKEPSIICGPAGYQACAEFFSNVKPYTGPHDNRILALERHDEL